MPRSVEEVLEEIELEREWCYDEEAWAEGKPKPKIEISRGVREAAAALVARGPREEPAPTYGKWSQPGVPHKGWTCIDEDIVEGDDLETCEMCEWAEVRYVHVMTHPEWEGELRVGCICAGHMQEDMAGAQRREAELKRRARNPDAAADLSWVQAADRIFGANTLAIGGTGPRLTEWELEFVSNIQARMLRSSRARTRKYQLSEKQMQRFKSIYLRMVGRNGGPG